jgi:hypothetical protein
MNLSHAWLAVAALSCCFLLSSRTAGAQCPAFGADTTCGTIITINTGSGAVITQTGQGPYDGFDDTMVGVVNNSNVPITSLIISSSLGIFGFDGDGIDTYGAPGNGMDSTGYGGPNTYFTNINGSQTSGTVNFITPLAPKGGSTYFSLENALASTAPCSTIVNGTVPTPTVSGTSISGTFTPNFGYSVAEAAVLCGFVDFDWVQTIVRLPNPAPYSALNLSVTASTGIVNGTSIPIQLGGKFSASVTGPVQLTAANAPFNDPPQGGGYTYNSASPDYSYPFYCNVLGDPACPRTTTSLSVGDAPADSCLLGTNGKPSAAYTGSAMIRALCGNKTSAAGSSIAFTTHLAGVQTDGTPKDLGIGYSWTSNFNGTTGGISTTKTINAPDPGSGTGGSTVINLNETTDYQYNGLSVTGINGATTQQILLNATQVAVTASGLTYSRVTKRFSGTLTLTNETTSAITGPLQLVFTFLPSAAAINEPTGMFGGFPYVTVTGNLAAGKSTSITVEFSDPSNASINFIPTIYTGSFN